MTSPPSDRPVSALRIRMIEDMTVRGFNGNTRSNYIRNVRAFAAFIGRSPGTATAEDLRRFQLHQTQSGMQPPSINSAVSALRFLFTVTLDRPDLARRRLRKREPAAIMYKTNSKTFPRIAWRNRGMAGKWKKGRSAHGKYHQITGANPA